MDYEKEYKGLVEELTRHMRPVGRMVKLQAFYNSGEDPAVKLSESPFIYRALVEAGAVEGKDSNGFKTLEIPYSYYSLLGIKKLT